MTVPIAKAISPGLGEAWFPGFQVPQEFINWILPKLLTAEEEQFLHATLRATKATVDAAQQSRFTILMDRIQNYLSRYGWPNFPEQYIRDAITRFKQPAEIVQALVAQIEGPGDRQLAQDMVRTWVQEAGSFGRNLMREPNFQTYSREARIDLGPVLVDLSRDDPNDYPQLIRDAIVRVRGIGREAKAGMREVLQEALRAGRNPLEAARQLRELPGFALTRNQARAVRSYREALEADRFGEAASRGLHDRRFGVPENEEAINRMVERYAERMASYRSRQIARSEMMTAVNRGSALAWQKLAETGEYESGELRRYWVTAPEFASAASLDSRSPGISGPCPICAPIPAMNEGGRGLEEFFETPEGPIDLPPVHPNCRCVIFFKPDFIAVARRQYAALQAS